VKATHEIGYELLNQKSKDSDRIRSIQVHASPDELSQFEVSGYLIREGLFSGEELVRLQDALDRLEVREQEKQSPNPAQKRSWGQIPRHLMDKDQAFLDLLKFEPVLSIARAMMGPLVRLRGLSARISYPGEVRHETPWHQHMRVISKPLPPWFSRPHGIDALIYLDELNEDTGPVCVVPGSHNWLDQEPPNEVYERIEGEEAICVPAGSCVLIHSNLWHRAMPTLGAKRRMLILGYTPTWLRRSPHGGPPPEDGLTQVALEEGDHETRVLLGVGGYT
jgi:ectoine hydroxylase-related dioxygenase (phytanoyl-CoA dioxygenase family)